MSPCWLERVKSVSIGAAPSPSVAPTENFPTSQKYDEGVMSRKRLTVWGAIGSVVLVVLAVGGVWGVNQTVFSPAGTVSTYLEALARGDSASALAIPGVSPRTLSAERQVLFASAAYTGPTDISVRTTAQAGDHADVVARYRLGTKTYETSFSLSRTSAIVFEQWQFDESPLAALEVSVVHGREFQVGRLGTIDIAAYPGGTVDVFSASATFPVFTGAAYRVFRDRPLVTAPASTIASVTPGQLYTASVTFEPTPEFIDETSQVIDEALDECATQKVLMPTDCPFGYATSNRFIGEPTWSIAEYPDVAISPGDDAWIVTGKGAAHITGTVKSLYDGSESPVDEDREFALTIHAFVLDDGRTFALAPP